MPTVFECLQQYCQQKEIRLPKRMWRCDLGHLVNSQWLKSGNIEKINYHYSEEPQGRFRVIFYPPSFAPTIFELIEQHFRSPHAGKTTRTSTNGYPSRNDPFRKGSERVNKPLSNPIRRDNNPFNKGITPLYLGLNKGNEGLNAPLSKDLAGVRAPFWKDTDTFHEDYTSLTQGEHNPSDPLRSNTDEKEAPQQNEPGKRPRKRIYRRGQ